MISHGSCCVYSEGSSIKYVTLFLANFYPFPPHVTLRHTSWDPPKIRHTSRFSEGLVQKTQTKATLYKFCLNCLWGFLSGGFCQGVFCLEGFVRGGFCPFPFCQNIYICYIRKLNITLNFMFRMYDKFVYKCDVTCSLPPSPVTNCHTFSDPSSSSVTYFMDGL